MNETELKQLTELDWGGLTVEFVRGNELIHLFNHDISNRKSLSRSLRFIKSRIAWCNSCMPNELLHTVVIDDTDRAVTDGMRKQIRDELEGFATNLRFASKGKR